MEDLHVHKYIKTVDSIVCTCEISYIVDTSAAYVWTDNKCFLTWNVKKSSAATFIMLQICRQLH